MHLEKKRKEKRREERRGEEKERKELSHSITHPFPLLLRAVAVIVVVAAYAAAVVAAAVVMLAMPDMPLRFYPGQPAGVTPMQGGSARTPGRPCLSRRFLRSRVTAADGDRSPFPAPGCRPGRLR